MKRYGLDIFFLVIIFVVSIFLSKDLLRPGFFPMHDDISVLRMVQMEKCFKDGQIPCRWAPDLDAGYGQPLFNFYSPFPFYFGMIFRLMGFQFIDAIKIVFLIPFVLSGFFMYVFLKEYFGKIEALVGAIFFITAPYRSVNIFVRGALAEATAIAFLPLLFYSLYKVIKDNNKIFIIVFAVSFCLFSLSHNISAMITTPILLLWSVLWAINFKKTKSLINVFYSFVLAIGLDAFFLFPAFFERKYVAIESLRLSYYDFRLHFVYLGQLFLIQYWDYGVSLGADSRMSFQIGWPHWWVIPIAFIFTFFAKAGKVKDAKKYGIYFFIIVFLGAVFLTSRRSIFVWNNLPFLPFVQFPWRFLSYMIFSASFCAAGAVYFSKKVFNKYIAVILTIILSFLAFALNYSFFHPLEMQEWVTDNYKLTRLQLENQMKSAMIDFLPNTVKEVPEKIIQLKPIMNKGSGGIDNYILKSNSWEFYLNVEGTDIAEISVPVFDFPGWEVFMDNKKINHGIDSRKGTFLLKIPPGKYLVAGRFGNTPVRKIANLISAVSFLFLVVFIFRVFLKRKQKG